MKQVPIVSSTGGLVDTVKEGYTGFHAGAFNVEVRRYDTFFFLILIEFKLKDYNLGYFLV